MTHAPQLFPNVRVAVIAYLNTSFGELDRLYSLDKAVAFQPERPRRNRRRLRPLAWRLAPRCCAICGTRRG
jgi:hypothetical protein